MSQGQSTDKLPSRLGSFMWRYLSSNKWCLAGLFLNALIWGLEMSLSPYLLKVIIDTTTQYAQNPTQLVSVVMLPCILLAAMTVVLNLNFRLHEYIYLLLFPSIKMAINKDMLTYVLHHSSTFFQNTFSGSIVKKIADISDNIENLIIIPSDLFLPFLTGLGVACTILVTVVHPLFGLILFVWTILFIYFTYKTSKGTEKYSRNASESNSKMIGTLSDSLSNVSSIKLFNNILHELLHFDNDAIKVANDERTLQWYNLKVNFIQEFGLTILISTMLIGLLIGSKQGWVSPGDFALVITLSMSFRTTIYDVGNQIQRFSKLLGTCKQALSIINIPHEILDAPDATSLVIAKGEIKFDNVSFRYENTKPLFERLTVTINPGEKVGLVGYSGGGKSSFIKLILRLMDTHKGQILIDNQDIKTVTQCSLREQIATIQQEPELFHRSIMENIRFANVTASDEDVYAAAIKARCHEFILELPNKYQTVVGERGIKLSGGQKQRISIARAFLKNAPILLLDEATSSLDSITEGYIQEALQEVMINKTTIIIAHRLSTLNKVDRLLVFVNGNIIEDDSLTALLANKDSHFYKLWKMQSQGFTPV